MTGWSQFHFGPFHFDGRLLFAGNKLLNLLEKDAEVLRLLLTKRRHLVETSELCPIFGRHADYRSVHSAINRVRKHLREGNKKHESEFIHTVAGGGYTFVHDVSVSHEPDADAEAYLYEGLTFWNDREPASLWRAKRCFDEATRADRRFAAAYSAEGDCYAVAGSYWWQLPPREAARRATNAAEQALQFDDRLAQPHATLGFVHSLFERRWQDAERRFEHALSLSPGYGVAHHWHALCLAAAGKLDRALDEIDEARKYDSRARSIEVHSATIRYWARDYAAAESLCKTAMTVHPEFYYASYTRGLVCEGLGRFADAVIWQRKANELARGELPYVSAALARAHALAGERQEAEVELAKATSSGTVFFHVAAAHVALGNHTLAFEYLRRAVEAQDVWVAFAAVDPRMDPIRGDGRFQELLESLNLAHVAPPRMPD